MKTIKYTILFGVILLLTGCGGSSVKYQKTPLDEVIKGLSQVKNFSIILYDMNYDEGARKYQHKYQVVVPKNDTVVSEISPWYTVSDVFFQKHVNNMGMEIATKKNGKLTKKASPPGYNHYVGNERYGRWTQRNGGSFWEFYGKYAFMSSMFNMMSNPIRRNHYYDYQSNYYGNRSYYGPYNNGRYAYGTNSRYNSSRKSTAWNRKPNTFKQKVRSRVKQSAATSKRRMRSTSRYGSSYRSRGGGFGK